MVRTCSSCGSLDIDEDAARGDATCMSCGTVLEESIVVTENQFQERAGGSGHTLVGQFVSAERAAANNFHGMGSQESREVTYAKGKKVIEEVASQLRINQHCIDTSYNFFKMCVGRNLTRGRTRTSVVAVCLYITCRLENTAHLLLDFSDITQINVFDLGRNLTFISRSLRINLPATDPCLYIMRFACVLDFGDQQKEVVNLATRLVQRMKRDWMSTGRRPTGICGAALLIAARSLNFNRSINDIVRVVHISESVIRKRLDEFSQTPSGSLTIDEFSVVDLEHSEDPPAFRESRRKAREEQLRKEAEEADVFAKDLGDMEHQVEIALDKKRKEKFSKSPFAKMVSGSLGLEKAADEMVRQEILSTVFKAAEEPPCTSETLKNQYEQYGPSLESLGIRKSTNSDFKVPTLTPITSSNSESLDMDDDISDSEIDTYILTEKEVAVKTDYWMKANGEVMKAIEERRREREENGEVKKKRKPTKKDNGAVCATALDAMEKVIHEKKLSNKVNYEMLKDLETMATPMGSKNKVDIKPIFRPPIREKIDTNADVTEESLTKSERIASRKNLKSALAKGSQMELLKNVFDTIGGKSKNEVKKEPETSEVAPTASETPAEAASTEEDVTIISSPVDKKPIVETKSRYAKLKPKIGAKVGKTEPKEAEPVKVAVETSKADIPSTSTATSVEPPKVDTKPVVKSRYGTRARPNVKPKTEETGEPTSKKSKT